MIATNLSVWMLMVVSEAIHILHLNEQDDYFSPYNTPHLENNITEKDLLNHNYDSQSSAHLKLSSKAAGKNLAEYKIMMHVTMKLLFFSQDSKAVDACSCNTSYCDAVATAASFLYPFEIEYSLIASCMVYIVWKHIGKVPPPCEEVTKPSYKFFNSYKGDVIFVVTHGADEISLNYF